MQFEQTDQFARYRRRSLADVESLRRPPEIDGHRREVDDRESREAAARHRREEIDNFVAVPGVTPEAGTAAGE